MKPTCDNCNYPLGRTRYSVGAYSYCSKKCSAGEPVNAKTYDVKNVSIEIGGKKIESFDIDFEPINVDRTVRAIQEQWNKEFKSMFSGNGLWLNDMCNTIDGGTGRVLWR